MSLRDILAPVLAEIKHHPVGGFDSAPIATLVAADAIPGPGWPIAVDRISGQARLAMAYTYTLSFAIGLSKGAASAGYTVEVVVGAATLLDWTAIAGTSSLAQGMPYFLGLGGGLSMTPPPDVAGYCVMAMGIAADAQTLDIRPGLPVLR